ncbi:protein smoothened-like [Drosophila ananassae]|uniref:protein smoothened-like n=1 Tax=Drosophila ananassae TaxID=7217 RepID=UPI001CFF958D|nr:protein smoothened-like [Drosophila ananassae]
MKNMELLLLCIVVFIGGTASSLAKFSSTTPASVKKSDVELEAINGTLNFRLYAKQGKDDKPWFDGLDSRQIQCVRRARCYATTNLTNTCFGSKFPHEMSSLDLTDFHTEKELNDKLNDYQAPRKVLQIHVVLVEIQMPKNQKRIIRIMMITITIMQITMLPITIRPTENRKRKWCPLIVM